MSMEQQQQQLISIITLLVVLLLLISSTVTTANEEEYVRPPPRKTLHFPWNPKPSSNPNQVHVSLAGERHMRVSWVIDDNSSPSIVEYGTSPGTYEATAVGDSTSYSFLFYKSGKIHHAVIGPLEHDTVYYYRCGGQDPEFQFKTPPSQFPVSFAVAGDLGQSGWTKTTLDHIDKCNYDMLLLPGDLAYADFIQRRWDTFGELVQPLASARPWMVTQGNHEKEHIPMLTDEFVSYNSRWKMPYEESGSGSNLYYSFDVAGAHIIMLGSYTDYDEYSDQYSWLKADLSKVNRTKTPWLLVLFHVPWYNSNEAHQCEGDGMMEVMEPLFHTARVDMVLSGHVHAYERSMRVNNGRPDPCGAPAWSVFREASFGHGELKIVNESHAYWSWHRNDDDEPVKSDHVWINSLKSEGCLVQDKGPELRKIL
ncbi:hypothetical protein ACFE04_022037 [Oxalis oulophora]